MLGCPDVNVKWNKPREWWFYKRVLCILFCDSGKLLVSVLDYPFEKAGSRNSHSEERQRHCVDQKLEAN